MTVTEDFSRAENTYQMEAEVCIQPNQNNNNKIIRNVARTNEDLQSVCPHTEE